MLGPELAREALARDRDLVLALAPEELLAGLGVALDADASGPPRRAASGRELSLSRSALEAGSTATGSVGVGERIGGRRQRRLARVERLSPVTVWTSLATAPISPAHELADGSCSLPLMRSTWPMRSSSPRAAFQTWSCDLMRARPDAEVGEPPDERVGRRLEDLEHERAGRVRARPRPLAACGPCAVTGGSSAGRAGSGRWRRAWPLTPMSRLAAVTAPAPGRSPGRPCGGRPRARRR